MGFLSLVIAGGGFVKQSPESTVLDGFPLRPPSRGFGQEVGHDRRGLATDC